MPSNKYARQFEEHFKPLERAFIVARLQQFKGNVRRTAVSLDIGLSTLERKMFHHGLLAAQFRKDLCDR